MDAYLYQAALICAECFEKTKRILNEQNTTDDGDSDNYPQGPYSDGRESDSPEHCDQCGIFLENDLTSDGFQYLCQDIIEYLAHGDGNKEYLKEMIAFYSIELSDLMEIKIPQTR